MASLSVADEVRKGAVVVHGADECRRHCDMMFQELGIPRGILPLKELEECGWVQQTGFVWIKQKAPSEHFFAGAKARARYDAEVTAYVEKRRMKKITGVRSKPVLVWLPVTEMSISEPDGDKMYVKTGLGIGTTYPTSVFLDIEEQNKQASRCPGE